MSGSQGALFWGGPSSMTELLRQHKRPKRGSICGGGAAVASVVMAEGRAGSSGWGGGKRGRRGMLAPLSGGGFVGDARVRFCAAAVCVCALLQTRLCHRTVG